MTVAALCAVGAEKALSNEVKKLALACDVSIAIKESYFGKVVCETELKGVYALLIGSRVADRILIQLASYRAEDFGALFEGAAAARAEDFIPRGTGLIVDKVRTRGSKLFAEKSVQAVVHKALAQRLCAKYRMNLLPDAEPRACVRVYVERDVASILLDVTGEPLYKRGYRLHGGIAPLRETTAASLMLMSFWKRKHPLCDPYCGSGTIALEAALYAFDIAPGLARRFAIDRTALADGKIEEAVRSGYRERIDLSRVVRISGSDKDNAAIELAKQNALRVWDIYKLYEHVQRGSRHLVTLNTLPMEDARAFEDDGFIITNPPYGNRLGDKESAEENYTKMAVLRKNFPRWKLVCISDNLEFETFFGAQAGAKKEITNGADALYVYEYDQQEEPKPKRRPEGKAMEKKPERDAVERQARNARQKHTYTW
ncbi:MAG: class I SAM-dependent RNA methyltransferase [Spirochaetaceae bacterium]|jgi:putative N6-adenine-specific DNA methylase|nr:class I SAM-dependent RNA methyltransferase [Spirochaetaceae bacterium]